MKQIKDFFNRTGYMFFALGAAALFVVAFAGPIEANSVTLNETPAPVCGDSGDDGDKGIPMCGEGGDDGGGSMPMCGEGGDDGGGSMPMCGEGGDDGGGNSL